MDIDKIVGSAALLGALIWFVKGLISELKTKIASLEIRVTKNSAAIDVLKSEHNSLEKKIDEIGKDIREIFIYIRNLNTKSHE